MMTISTFAVHHIRYLTNTRSNNTIIMGMGKRTREKRLREIATETTELLHTQAQEEKTHLLRDDELFQIDTQGKKKSNKEKKVKDPSIWSSKGFEATKRSKYEQKQINKMQQRVSSQSKKTRKTESELWSAPFTAHQLQPVVKNLVYEHAHDFIKDAVVTTQRLRKHIPSTRHNIDKVAIAQPGQSYHPALDDHQEIVAVAVSKELERLEKVRQSKEPLSKGLEVETLQYMNEASEASEEEEEEEVSRTLGQQNFTKTKKKPEKLTRADLNKRQRHRLVEAAHEVQRGIKRQTKEINKARDLVHAIKREAQECAQRRDIQAFYQAQKLQDGPTFVKVGGKKKEVVGDSSVLLSDELSGNLRELKPKGNCLAERYTSFHVRNMIEIGGPNKKGGRAHLSRRNFKIIET